MQWQPTSIETVDSKVLNLAMGDIVWDSVRNYFPEKRVTRSFRGSIWWSTPVMMRRSCAKRSKLCRHLEQIGGEPGKASLQRGVWRQRDQQGLGHA